jgi:hypothetical protein
MNTTIAFAVLMAATGLTPVSAQEAVTEAPRAMSPRAIALPPSAPLQIAQNDQRRERGERGRFDSGRESGQRVYEPIDQQRQGRGNGQQRQQLPSDTGRQIAPVTQVPAVEGQRQWTRNTDGSGNGSRNRQQIPGQAASGLGGRQGWRNRDGADTARPWQPPVQPSATFDRRAQVNVVPPDGGRRDRSVNGFGAESPRRDTWRGNNVRNDGFRSDNWRDNGGRTSQSWSGQSWGSQNWNGQNWNRRWRNDRQYDWQRYRYDNRNLFSRQRYSVPYGWNYGYRRFSIGFSLSNILFDRQYWIDDPYSFRLPPAYGPYRWVRYYDDVMLVDLRSGQIVDVIYDFFW